MFLEFGPHIFKSVGEINFSIHKVRNISIFSSHVGPLEVWRAAGYLSMF